MRDNVGFPRLLQPYPDFGFTNELLFDEEKSAEMKDFWKVMSDFIFSEEPKFERLKNFVNFQTEFFGNCSKEERSELQSIFVSRCRGAGQATKKEDLDAMKTVTTITQTHETSQDRDITSPNPQFAATGNAWNGSKRK